MNARDALIQELKEWDGPEPSGRYYGKDADAIIAALRADPEALADLCGPMMAVAEHDDVRPTNEMTTYRRADGELINGEFSFTTTPEFFEDDDEPNEVVREDWLLVRRTTVMIPEPREDDDDDED